MKSVQNAVLIKCFQEFSRVFNTGTQQKHTFKKNRQGIMLDHIEKYIFIKIIIIINVN